MNKPRHERKMKGHVALVALARAEITDRILRPLVGFGEQHAVAVFFVHMLAQSLSDKRASRGRFSHEVPSRS